MNAKIKRHPLNPILSAKDLAYPSNLVFNAGVCKCQGKYIMAFRNDYGYGDTAPGRFTGTNIGLAFSEDGVRWTPAPKPWIEWKDAEVGRAYDPRITIVDGRIVLCFAVDTAHGVRGGIATTEDFDKWEIVSLSTPDNRNMVVFPEKIGGKFARLERPFPVYSRGRDRFDMWFSDSPDLAYWGNTRLAMGVEDVPFANDKIGPAAPPVKTPKGWLTTFHAVWRDNARGKNGWEEKWQKMYYAGIALLDLDEPWKIIGLCKEPLLSPEAPYEADEGFRTHVIFPGGMVLEDSGEVKIYYGAADTVECLATADVADLIAMCAPYSR